MEKRSSNNKAACEIDLFVRLFWIICLITLELIDYIPSQLYVCPFFSILSNKKGTTLTYKFFYDAKGRDVARMSIGIRSVKMNRELSAAS